MNFAKWMINLFLNRYSSRVANARRVCSTYYESLRIFVRLYLFYVHFNGFATKEYELVGIDKNCIRLFAILCGAPTYLLYQKIRIFIKFAKWMINWFLNRYSSRVANARRVCSTSILGVLRILTYLPTSLSILCTFCTRSIGNLYFATSKISLRILVQLYRRIKQTRETIVGAQKSR